MFVIAWFACRYKTNALEEYSCWRWFWCTKTYCKCLNFAWYMRICSQMTC